MLTLETLKKQSKNTSRGKRRGRGSASGRGNYSTRGMKGQRSRTGGRKGLIQFGVRGYLLRIPKTRGFKSLATPFEVVNLTILQEKFTDNAVVTPKTLRATGIIAYPNRQIKILGQGKLSKKLKVTAHAFSASARQAIIKAGGSIEVIKGKTKAEKQALPKSKIAS